ncbi:Unusual protein kinase [Bifidobacterium animalis subsp. lactis ATCC 27673]|uniref:ABC1 kinase family protein n=1 Tax=Bifidobacterium animalis TaxID=28025 RepID=UPI0003B02024|nr:AarF/UbiB family protein [Bifidobacterium animalis]AGW84430.1 Unusual protein kinase [Bifidobacterium animalis subsp. lactis ATCC 27673]KOA48065.1 protein kinase [Bifidobacterium animalis subsp. lactis ATCC 27673]
MSDKNSDKSKRETEAHELRRDVRREEAGQRRQQRKDACEARHLEHEEKRETSELIDLSNRLENQEAHSDGPAFDNPTDDALRATVETAESEKILHLGDEVDEQGATIEHNLQREEAEQSGGEASETAAQPETPAPQSAQSERLADAHTHDIPASIARRQQPQVEETIGLFGMHKRNFSSEYHLTRMSKAKRLKQIGKIALEYDALHGLTPVKMRLMFEALGPTFVKVGQILSMRSEILPESFCAELSKLRADADPMPYAIVLGTLENEYQRPIDEIFEHIDTTPLGSASLAQVHRATLKTGEDVAVKVQRPGVRETMAQDVSIMRSLAKGATKIMHSSQVVDFRGVVEELWETFDEETNFLNEARNLAEFKRFCSHYAYMDCPTPFTDLCTEHVLVMQYIDGIPISHTRELIDDGYSLNEIGTKLVDNYAAQILDAGFFHADPHPGNIEIRGGKIILLDLGMTGRLDARTRVALKQMLFAVAKQNSADLADALLRFAGTDVERADYPSLLGDLDGIVEEFGTVDLADLDLAAFITSLTQMARRHGIEIPSSVTTVGRALVTLEGLLDEFIPNVNMIEIISQHIESSKTPVEMVKSEVKRLGIESEQALHSGLKGIVDAQTALHMLTRGELKMNLELVGSEEPLSQMSDMVNRLTMALIVVGLFIGSSIVYFAGMKPIIFGIPVVGFLGYVAAFVLSVWIVIDILIKRHAAKHKARK